MFSISESLLIVSHSPSDRLGLSDFRTALYQVQLVELSLAVCCLVPLVPSLVPTWDLNGAETPAARRKKWMKTSFDLRSRRAANLQMPWRAKLVAG